MKIGIGLLVVTLLTTALLFLAGVPPARQVSVVHTSGPATTIDSSWQVRWYALVLAGGLIAGVCLIISASFEKEGG